MDKWRPRMFVAVLAVLTAAPITAGAAELQLGRFVDDDHSVHESDIESLAEAGITRGCNPPANDEYCPEDPVTRAQMASFLVRALELPAAESGQFVDIEGSVHAGDIEALGATGITRGCNPPTNDEYCPQDPVTRAQMASFLVRALELPAESSGQFTDVSDSVHQADIEALGASGITRGCNPPANDRYCPEDPVTRAQMASFLVRALDQMEPIEPDPSVSGTLEVRFLDIEFGDSALYIGECGEVGLIDAAVDQEEEILAALDGLGVEELEWILVSHYDRDSVGGVRAIGESGQVEIGTLYDRGGGADAVHPDDPGGDTYAHYYEWASEFDPHVQVARGDQITLCDGEEMVEFNVLSVANNGEAAGGLEVEDENDKSICLKIEFGNFDLSSCGDIHGDDDSPSGDDVDLESVVAPMMGEVEVAKINKHGSNDSSNQTWIDTLSAQAAVLTPAQILEDAEESEYPDQEVMDRWVASGADLYGNQNNEVTPILNDGLVTITTGGIESFTVETSASGRSETYPLDEVN